MVTKATERLNRYTCNACGGSIVTMDADVGTTPFMLGCLAAEGCKGTMTSCLYRGVTGPAAFVWRKPTPDEYEAASPPMRHHFDQGGLDIFRIQ